MKRVLLMFGFMLCWIVGFSQNRTYQLSSHILDIQEGQPAPDVKIVLSQMQDDGTWKAIEEKWTDTNGRVKDFLEEGGDKHRGVYKLTYHVAPYFEKLKQKTFYPFIEVIFEINDDQHYHVPITLSAYGYSTYRGN